MATGREVANVYSINEAKLRLKPTKSDFSQVRRLLNDFDLDSVEIPQCSTLSQLHSWRKSVIDKALSR